MSWWNGIENFSVESDFADTEVFKDKSTALDYAKVIKDAGAKWVRVTEIICEWGEAP